jgi:tRNA U55 pseudouridine synthase TruB
MTSYSTRILWETIREAARSSTGNRLRSFLGTLAVAVAVGAIAVVVEGLDGFARYSRQISARAFGSDTFLLARVVQGELSRRELAARLGEALGCGGALSRLRRTASGPFLVEHARTLEELVRGLEHGEDVMMPMAVALRGRVSVEVEEAAIEPVRNGSRLDGSMLRRRDEGIVRGDAVAVYGRGELLGIHHVDSVSPFSSRAIRMLPQR